MKQKIVIKVQVRCKKCRAKAMETAAGADGVISVALEGESKDQVVVIGDGVDAVDLTMELDRKLGHASLEMVEEVQEKKQQKDEKKDNKPPAPTPTPITSCSFVETYQPQYEIYRVANDPQPGPCIIM